MKQFRFLSQRNPHLIAEQLTEAAAEGWKIEAAYATVDQGITVHYVILSRETPA